MKKLSYIAIVIGILMGTTACQQTLRDFTRDAILEVNGEILYQDEIDEFIPKGINPSDSLYLIETYKKQWVTRVLMYKMAYDNVGKSEEIKEMTESYRKELTINQYQQQLIAEKLEDVAENSLISYYEKHKALFPLNEAVIKGIFIKVATSETNQDELKKWLSNTTDQNLENIMGYCTQHAVQHEFFLEGWTPYNKIASMLPEHLDSNDPILTRGTVIQNKEGFTYYLRITGKCNAGTPQPYEMIQPELHNILLNQEKIRFINQFQQSLYDNAVENGDIIFFDNE